MTHTEFIVRSKTGGGHPLFRNTHIEFRPVDGLYILGFLAVFVGMLLLLSK